MLAVELDYFDVGTPWAGLNGAELALPCCALDLALGAMTVGRPRTAPTAWRRLLQMASVALDVLGNVDSGPPRPFGLGPLAATPEYWDLDPTERGAATYRIGMGAAKFVGESLFGIVEMLHLSLFAADPAAPLITATDGSQRRADLVAEDNIGNWIYVEAKGRCETADVRKARRDAKAQVEALSLLTATGAAFPSWLRLASVIDLAAAPFKVHVDDPPGQSSDGGEAYQIDPRAMRDYYYAPLHDLREVMAQRPGDVIDAEGVRAIAIADGVALGARTDLLVSPASGGERPRPSTTEARRTVVTAGYRGTIGGDGYALLVAPDRYA